MFISQRNPVSMLIHWRTWPSKLASPSSCTLRCQAPPRPQWSGPKAAPRFPRATASRSSRHPGTRRSWSTTLRWATHPPTRSTSTTSTGARLPQSMWKSLVSITSYSFVKKASSQCGGVMVYLRIDTCWLYLSRRKKKNQVRLIHGMRFLLILFKLVKIWGIGSCNGTRFRIRWKINILFNSALPHGIEHAKSHTIAWSTIRIFLAFVHISETIQISCSLICIKYLLLEFWQTYLALLPTWRWQCRGDHLAILGAPLGRRQLCRHSLRGGVHREESKQVAGELIQPQGGSTKRHNPLKTSPEYSINNCGLALKVTMGNVVL